MFVYITRKCWHWDTRDIETLLENVAKFVTATFPVIAKFCPYEPFRIAI